MIKAMQSLILVCISFIVGIVLASSIVPVLGYYYFPPRIYPVLPPPYYYYPPRVIIILPPPVIYPPLPPHYPYLYPYPFPHFP